MKIRKKRGNFHELKSILKKYLIFYNENLRKKHIVVYILSLIVFGFLMITFINNLNETNEFLAKYNNLKQNSNIFMTIVKEKIPAVILIIFSGITPYICIPLMGIIGYPYILSKAIMNMSALNMLLACIGSVVQLFSISLAIAAGIYYWSSSTKKFKYGQSQTFGLDDVREQIYEATKKKDKLNKIKQKKQAKLDKIQKLNVKIEYKNLIITGIISSIIVVLASIITGV